MELTESEKNKLYLREFQAYLICLDRSNTTIKVYSEHVTEFSKWFEKFNSMEFDVCIITEVDLRDFRSYLQDSKRLKPTSVNLKLASLKNYFHFLSEEKIISKNPAANIKKVKIQNLPEAKSPDEQFFKALRREILRFGNPSHYLMLCLMGYNGLRVSELASLRLSDLKLGNKSYVTITGKGNKNRTIAIHSEVKSAYQEYIEIRKRLRTNYDNVFISQRKVPYTRTAIWKIIHRYSKRLGNPISCHSLRHYFCRSLLRKGVDISSISILAGHSSPFITGKIYTVPKQDELDDAISKL